MTKLSLVHKKLVLGGARSVAHLIYVGVRSYKGTQMMFSFHQFKLMFPPPFPY